MESRKLNMQFVKSGSGSTTTRLALPITWIRTMGITPEDRQVEVKFNEKSGEITIKKLK